MVVVGATSSIIKSEYGCEWVVEQLTSISKALNTILIL
jgi:hypothetical protein